MHPLRQILAPPKPLVSSEKEQHQTTKGNETAQDNSIPPLLRSYPSHQTVDAWDLTCCTNYPSVYTSQSFPLRPKAFIDGVCLAQYTIRHTVTVVYSPPLIEHIICLRLPWVRGSIGINIGAHI